ncbi:hypothetical protein RB601_000657 [Gaeumannomyces tritici]
MPATFDPKPARGAAGPPALSIRRCTKRHSPWGTSSFIGLRILDLGLQYKLLSGAWSVPILSCLGLAVAAPVVSSAATAHTGIPAVDRLGPSAPSLLLLGMTAGGLAKQSYALLRTQLEEFSLPVALFGVGFNVTYSSVNSLLLVAAAGPHVLVPLAGVSLPLPMVLRAAVFGLGIFLELGSETQRRRFKGREENKGRICTTGFWKLARHINYGGYTLWRAGTTLAAGSWPASVAAVAFNAWGFIGMSAVELSQYMLKKYGKQWERYQREVPWLLLPGIYQVVEGPWESPWA